MQRHGLAQPAFQLGAQFQQGQHVRLPVFIMIYCIYAITFPRFSVYTIKMDKLITWDEPKRQANIAKHGLDFADLTYEFFLNATVVDAKDGRLVAIGMLADGTVTTIFVTLGTEAVSVISLRPASKKEREIHEGI